MAVTSTKVVSQSGHLQLGTTNASSVYLNPNIPESAELISSYKNISGSPSNSCSIVQHLPAVSTTQVEVTLADLQQRTQDDLTGIVFTCNSCLTEYTAISRWCSAACPMCPLAVDICEKDWFCTSHGTTSTPTWFYNRRRYRNCITNHL